MNAVVANLQEQFDYYLDHQDEYVNAYNGKVIVIKDFEFMGSYSSALEAVRDMQSRGHSLGSFLVQKVSPGNQAYTINISTPYAVAIQ